MSNQSKPVNKRIEDLLKRSLTTHNAPPMPSQLWADIKSGDVRKIAQSMKP